MASPQDTSPLVKLTPKQKLFVEAYLTNNFNAHQAALSAGYSPESARVIGPENLSKPAIKAIVDTYIAELSMSKGEVLLRLSAHARGDIGEIWNPSTGQVDWEEAKAKGLTSLIKKIKHKTTRITRDDGTDVETFEDEIELHNPQVALQLLGKQHGLFVDKSETKITAEVNVKTYKGISPDDWDDTDTGT